MVFTTRATAPTWFRVLALMLAPVNFDAMFDEALKRNAASVQH